MGFRWDIDWQRKVLRSIQRAIHLEIASGNTHILCELVLRQCQGEILQVPGSGVKISTEENGGVRRLKWQGLPFPDLVQAKNTKTLDDVLKGTVLALISHDEMKGRMLDFVIDHEQELRKFGRILATVTTGRLVGETAPSLSGNIYKYHLGPKCGNRNGNTIRWMPFRDLFRRPVTSSSSY